MSILRFLVSKLRNEEWFRFHTEFFGLAKAYGLELLGILRIFALYEILYQEADDLLEILRSSFLTIDTTTADRQRDDMYRGFRDAVKSNLRILDDAKKAAAQKVYAIVRKYSDTIQRGGRSAKTAAIDNLLQDLTQGEGSVDLSAEIHTLGLEKWVDDLDAANTAFKQSLAERAGEAADRPEAGKLQQVRAKMDHYYVNMINSIDTLLVAIEDGAAGEEANEDNSGSGPVEDRGTSVDLADEKIIRFSKELNSYVTHYKSLLRGRRTRKTDNSGEPKAE
ncbi:MAG: DUF6261 family protein [Tannerellaceae bacterium]|jgi:hypothetical protein|nr:DUF6261 family protein [Tannerellaceae bacterium]